MEPPLQDNLSMMADSMGIALYQRFTMNEASLFLRCPLSDIRSLVKKTEIEYIQVSKTEVQFFGYQLLQHLLNNVIASPTTPDTTKQSDDSQDRIIRTQEVQQLIGLSRSTIWRLERKGDFPARLPLGTGSVGWLKSDIKAWIRSRK